MAKTKDVRFNLEPDGKWRHTETLDMVHEKVMGRADSIRCACEACGSGRVRYAFILKHPEYGTIRCGRTCAGKLLGKTADVAAMEKRAMEESLRREVFMDQIWRFNAEKKTWFLRYEGIGITIIHSRFGGFGVLMGEHQAIWRRKGNPLATLEDAKEAAFDVILSAEKRAKKRRH